MNWYKYTPSQALSLVSCIPDGTQRGEFLLLMNLCLEHGPLPDDDARIALRAAIPIERVRALRPYLNELSTVKDGLLMIDLAATLVKERKEYGERMALNGSKGGRPKAEAEQSPAKPGKAELSSDNGRKPTGYQTQAQLNRAKPGLTEQSEAKPSKPNHAIMQSCNQSNPLSSSDLGKTNDKKIINLPRGNALPRSESLEDLTTTSEQAGDDGLGDAIRDALHLPASTNTNMAKDPVFQAVVELQQIGVTAAEVHEFAKWWNDQHKGSRFVLSVPFLRRDIGGWYAKKYGGKNGKVHSIASHQRDGSSRVSKWIADCPTITGRT